MKTLNYMSTEYINPITPKSDQHLISPYNITPESLIKVRRIKEWSPTKEAFDQ